MENILTSVSLKLVDNSWLGFGKWNGHGQPLYTCCTSMVLGAPTPGLIPKDDVVDQEITSDALGTPKR
jgi:hypothetical protein